VYILRGRVREEGRGEPRERCVWRRLGCRLEWRPKSTFFMTRAAKGKDCELTILQCWCGHIEQIYQVVASVQSSRRKCVNGPRRRRDVVGQILLSRTGLMGF
jgi:hypothetical protein